MAKKANLEDGRTVTAEEEAKLSKKITENKIYICEKCGCRLRLVRLPGAPYFAEFSADNPHSPNCANNKHRPPGQRGGRAIAVATNDPNEIDIQEVLGELQLPVCFLQVQIPEICRQKWRILHLRFGESCRLPGRIA